MSVIVTSLPYLLQATVLTIYLSVVCFGAGLALGAGLGMLGAIGPAPLRAAITAYVFLVRGVPVLVLLFFVFFALPLWGVEVPAFTSAAVALSLYTAAFASEIVRGAIASVAKGQTDAAKALGYTRFGTLRHIVLPQAFRYMLPPFVGLAATVIKATSIASLINLTELTLAAKEVLQRTVAPFEIWGVSMLIYFVLCYSLSLLGRRLERRAAVLH
jgi:polar amino acid transport system permease protein